MNHEEIEIKQAVIYARVSSAKQMKQGDGLSSQETRCREYAQFKGYDVAACFTDDITGHVLTRPRPASHAQIHP